MGEAISWAISIDRDLSEDGALEDTWVTQLSGLLKWSGSITGNFDTAETSPFDAAIATATKKFYLYPVAGTTANYYYGNGWPKLSVDAGMGGTATFTLDFDGDGQLARN